MDFEPPKLKVGDIFLYPFRFSWDSFEDPESLGKYRPAMVVATLDEKIMFCSVTTATVYPPNEYVVVPKIEAKRANLAALFTSKIVTSEVNFDSIKNEGTMRGRILPGNFSSHFFDGIRATILENNHKKKLRIVKRKLVINRKLTSAPASLDMP